MIGKIAASKVADKGQIRKGESGAKFDTGKVQGILITVDVLFLSEDRTGKAQ
jgi:hypothetical protein